MNRSRWTANGDVRLHYLDAGGDGTPVLFVPGMSDTAAEYEWLLDTWAPRRTLVVDLRGRGASDAPGAGYTFDDHVDDVDAIVRDAGVDRLHVVTYSRGTTYGLGWALRHPERVVSLAVGDYNARQMGMAEDWPDWWMRTKWRGTPMTERMQEHAVRGVQRDSCDLFFWDDLHVLDCPVLVVAAGVKPVLDTEGLAQWQAAVPHAETAVFDDSPHDLFKGDRDRFPRLVAEFHDRSETR